MTIRAVLAVVMALLGALSVGPARALNEPEPDRPSGIERFEPTPVQVDNLVTLGKVWGFLKYHHPKVTAGAFDWDRELFRVMPAVIAAPDRAAADAAMLKWIDALGAVAPCRVCATLAPDDLQLRPPIGWLHDTRRLGVPLARRLQAIYNARPIEKKQHYVSIAPWPDHDTHFEHEAAYERAAFPDGGLQLLGLYRFWNVIAYWFPYRDVLGEDWDAVLATSVPRFAGAADADAYAREALALAARAHDTHAYTWRNFDVRPPAGACGLPVEMRFLGARAIVAAPAQLRGVAPVVALRLGDEITAIEGRPLAALLREWTPYYAVSNEASLQREIGRQMTRGACGDVTLGVRRDGRDMTLISCRVPLAEFNWWRYHDRPGPSFQALSGAAGEVAYLKLSNVKLAEVPGQLAAAAISRGLIIDLRNYPGEDVGWTLARLFTDQPFSFVRTTQVDLRNPGAFRWMAPFVLRPTTRYYAGRVVVLVDEVTQSNAEFTAMGLRAVGATIVGSQTAGADGDVARLTLPGNVQTAISGKGMFYPDKRPTQRIGIVPDIEARPTVTGLRDGRDEVLEAGLRVILGADADAAAIEAMARHAPD